MCYHICDNGILRTKVSNVTTKAGKSNYQLPSTFFDNKGDVIGVSIRGPGPDRYSLDGNALINEKVLRGSFITIKDCKNTDVIELPLETLLRCCGNSPGFYPLCKAKFSTSEGAKITFKGDIANMVDDEDFELIWWYQDNQVC